MVFFCADHIPRGVSFFSECDALLPFQVFPPTSLEQITFVLREFKQFFDDTATRTHNQAEQLKNDLVTIGRQMARKASIKRALVVRETKNSLVLSRSQFTGFRKDVEKLHRELLRSMGKTAEENARAIKPVRKRKRNEESDDYVDKKIK